MNDEKVLTLWPGGPVRQGDPSPWIACEQPERPMDRGIGYHADCDACMVACQAHVAMASAAASAILAALQSAGTGEP